MLKMAVSAAFLLSVAGSVSAQDIAGIENCSAEKAMDRRTGCLQSNVNYLYAQLIKANADSRAKLDATSQKLDAANAEIATLKATVAKLQVSLNELQAVAKKPVDSKSK